MQKTFKAVRSGDINTLRKILESKPNEIHAIAKQPPKKDDGQSLLQVALKTGKLEIANLLLDHHADVNFMESEDCCNEWRIPVLHDAIRCAIMNCRWNSMDYFTKEYEMYSTKERADQTYALLKRILDMGADIFSKDSYGNTTLERAILDSRQILPTYSYTTKSVSDNRILTKELRSDLARIFILLFQSGASSQWTDRTSGKSLKECYCEEPVSEFLNISIPTKNKPSILSKLLHK